MAIPVGEIRMQRFVVISGCSGGGKSTLLAELSSRGYAVFEEPGRAIVKEQLACGGDWLPWADADKFVEACIARALEQLGQAAQVHGLAFFDRSVLDALNALETLRRPVPERFRGAIKQLCYHERVFMTPPWREIYTTDTERRHGFAQAVTEFETLQRFYARHGYEVLMVPKLTPEARADFVLAHVGRDSAG